MSVTSAASAVRTGRRAARRRRAGLAVLLAGLALAVGACAGGAPSGTAVASLPTTAAASTQPAANSGRDPVKYSQCMRAHGVKKFPDPNPQGGLGIDAAKLGMTPDSPVFKAADAACKSFMPQGPPPDPKQAAAAQQQVLAYSRCMRSHGVKNFPDPKFSGNGAGITLPRSVNPNSPQFKAAQQACQKLMQGAAGGGPGQGSSDEKQGWANS